MEDLEFGIALAVDAGKIMQSERQGRLQIKRKPDRTLVTHVDLAIQDLAIDEITRNFPGQTIIGEERSFGPDTAQSIWYVDPLDGTGEYVEGENAGTLTCGFGLAKQYNGRIEIGLFFNPFRDELYTAVYGLGALLNGQRIQVNNTPFTRGIAYDYSYWDGAQPDTRKLETLLGPTLKHYSAIYQSCVVALGRSAFSVFPGETKHDIAPGLILVSEAGGQVSDTEGQPHDWRGKVHGAVFSNGVTHQRVLNAINS